MDIPFRMRQTRIRQVPRESQSGFNCQISSTRAAEYRRVAMASCSAPFRDQTPADVVRCTSAAVGDAFDAATSKFGAITIGQWSDMFGNVILVGVMLGVAYGFWRGAILSFNWITEGAVQLKQTNVDGSPETVADTASRIQNDLVLAALLTVLCAILAGVSV